MPYNRYDIKNKYSYSGKRKNEPVVLKTVMLILIPILIIAVVSLGIFISYKVNVAPKDNPVSPATPEEIPLLSDEELLTYVNERYPLAEDFVPSLVPFGGVQVSKAMFDDLDRMINSASKEGINITVTEGYISYADQGELYSEALAEVKASGKYSEIKAESETKKVCPEAGCSEAQTGLLIKLSTSEEAKSFEATKAFDWLERHAMTYGFVLRYPEDGEDTTGRTYNPQLYRYVGPEHALNMPRYDMMLEEYSAHVSSQ